MTSDARAALAEARDSVERSLPQAVLEPVALPYPTLICQEIAF